MTAEIAALNKLAVALAADSAVTVMSQARQAKIYNTVNKLFALSKYHPVGIMVYGGAELMGVPWETVVKMYRPSLHTKRFDTLEGYADHFLKFLADDKVIVSPKQEAQFLKDTLADFYEALVAAVTNNVETSMKKGGQVTLQQVGQVVDDLVSKSWESWQKAKVLEHIREKPFYKEVVATHGAMINESIANAFQKLPISPKARRTLIDLAVGLLCRDRFSEEHSGVVIAGFGDKEPYPSLLAYVVDLRACGKLKYRQDQKVTIGAGSGSAIVPFAQYEMVDAFMRGIDPRFGQAILNSVERVLQVLPERLVKDLPDLTAERQAEFVAAARHAAERLHDEYYKGMRELSADKFTAPVLDAVESLPKDELAAVAEELVNLTKFKRRISMDQETVGGPIDVAVISRGDGLVWIKRKHYFEPGLNPHFVANYFREVGEDE